MLPRERVARLLDRGSPFLELSPLAGLGMLTIPLIHTPALLFVPMIGIGLAWASIMGNPYVMLAGCIPAERTGVYMGIFNMFIVIPMILIAATLPFYYHSLLGGDARHVGPEIRKHQVADDAQIVHRRGAHLVGAVPHFDAETLAPLSPSELYKLYMDIFGIRPKSPNPAYLRRQLDENTQSQTVQKRFIGEQEAETKRQDE